MATQPNIVYLLGAGASYQAIPIIDQLGSEMMELALQHSDIVRDKDWALGFGSGEYNLNLGTDMDNLLASIYYFGKKSIEFGTIDTYAKSLFFRGARDELQRLKIAMSAFFSLWTFSTTPKRIRQQSSEKEKPDNQDYYVPIDKRLISLMATLIEINEPLQSVLKPNITFITWNYDLQLERAFTFITRNSTQWSDVRESINFYDVNTNDPSIDKRIRIFHLNGFHGLSQHSSENEDYNKEKMIFHIENVGRTFDDALQQFGKILGGQIGGHNTFEHTINFAWENNKRARLNTDAAKASLQNADTLIIVGYSFPPFNREIDNELLGSIPRTAKVYYQDPNPNTSVADSLVNLDKQKIWPISEPSSLNQIFIPPIF